MISSFNGYSSTILMRTLNTNANTLEDLSVQLSTRKKSQTYGGLGGDVGQALDLRAQINSIEGYKSSIDQANLQLSMMDIALNRIVETGSEVSGSATGTQYDITSNNQSTGQMTTTTFVKEVLSLLDTEVDGDYVFSGNSTDVRPTLSYDQIVYGHNGEDGLLVVTDERIRADAGADGLGRLDLSRTASTVTLAEQATDFGYKLDTVTSNLSNTSITGPTGTPQTLSINVTGSIEPNEVLSVGFTLPDGSHEVIKLIAGATNDPGEGIFSVNGTTDDVATAIQSVLDYQIKNNVAYEGEASSRIQAALDFYLTSGNGEPKRVVGANPETATTLDSATAAGKPTVNWYVGDNEAGSARDTATALVDNHLKVSYGARANEDSIARQLAYMTAFTLPKYDQDSTTDQNRYTEFADAISSGLSSVTQGDVVKTIHTELGIAKKIMTDADQRHVTTLSMLKTASDDIEGINQEEVAAKIMTIRNTIEASYQATSMIYQLTLTDYM